MLARNKRVVNGRNLTDMLLHEWVDPLSFGAMEVFNQATRKFISLTQDDPAFLGMANKLGLENVLVSLAHSIVNVTIPYRYDQDSFKRVDWWCLPTETWDWKLGDCEDTAFLLSSAIEQILAFTGVKNEKRYYATVGYYYDSQQYWGHGYVLYFNGYIKKWVILETTLETEVSPSMWQNWNPEQYIPAIIFNRKECFTLFQGDAQKNLNLSSDYVTKHQTVIQDMVDYVKAGKQLPVSWRHKTSNRKIDVTFEAIPEQTSHEPT